MTRWRLGEVDTAAGLAERAFTEFARLSSPWERRGHSRCSARSAIGRAARTRPWTGLQRGLDLARSAGLRGAEGRLLHGLGMVHGRQERSKLAAEYFRQSAEAAEEVGDALGLAEARAAGAYFAAEPGQHDLAATMAEEALVVQLEHGRPMLHAMAMITYGMVLTKMARYPDAVDMFSDALEIGRSLESLQVVAQVLNALGEAHRLNGDYDLASERHREALEAAERSGDRLEIACALEGLGDSHAAAADHARALGHWARAYETYIEIGHPGAARVAEHLSSGPLQGTGHLAVSREPVTIVGWSVLGGQRLHDPRTRAGVGADELGATPHDRPVRSGPIPKPRRSHPHRGQAVTCSSHEPEKE